MKDKRTVEAITKIRAILREYDLVGFLAIISPDRAHWCHHVDASWSALYIGDDGKAQVRAKRADFKTSEEHKRVVELTAHIIYSGRDLATQQFLAMDALVKMLEQHLSVEHESYKDVEHYTAGEKS